MFPFGQKSDFGVVQKAVQSVGFFFLTVAAASLSVFSFSSNDYAVDVPISSPHPAYQLDDILYKSQIRIKSNGPLHVVHSRGNRGTVSFGGRPQSRQKITIRKRKPTNAAHAKWNKVQSVVVSRSGSPRARWGGPQVVVNNPATPQRVSIRRTEPSIWPGTAQDPQPSDVAGSGQRTVMENIFTGAALGAGSAVGHRTASSLMDVVGGGRGHGASSVNTGHSEQSRADDSPETESRVVHVHPAASPELRSSQPQPAPYQSGPIGSGPIGSGPIGSEPFASEPIAGSPVRLVISSLDLEEAMEQGVLQPVKLSRAYDQLQARKLSEIPNRDKLAAATAPSSPALVAVTRPHSSAAPPGDFSAMVAVTPPQSSAALPAVTPQPLPAALPALPAAVLPLVAVTPPQSSSGLPADVATCSPVLVADTPPQSSTALPAEVPTTSSSAMVAVTPPQSSSALPAVTPQPLPAALPADVPPVAVTPKRSSSGGQLVEGAPEQSPARLASVAAPLSSEDQGAEPIKSADHATF